jgi:hypothetical protein
VSSAQGGVEPESLSDLERVTRPPGRLAERWPQDRKRLISFELQEELTGCVEAMCGLLLAGAVESGLDSGAFVPEAVHA